MVLFNPVQIRVLKGIRESKEFCFFSLFLFSSLLPTLPHLQVALWLQAEKRNIQVFNCIDEFINGFSHAILDHSMSNFSVIKMSVFWAEWLCWNNHGSFASVTDNGNSSIQSRATLNGWVAESWERNLKPLVKISVCQVHRKLSFLYSNSKRSFQKCPSSERCTFQN